PHVDPRDRHSFPTRRSSDLESGKLLFDLYGHKLRGRWTLVKTKRGAKDWLLIKERDAYARQGDAARLPDDSVLSGRTVEHVASGDRKSTRLNSSHVKISYAV